MKNNNAFKKLLAVLLPLSMLIAAAGCSQAADPADLGEGTDTVAVNEETAVTTPDITAEPAVTSAVQTQEVQTQTAAPNQTSNTAAATQAPIVTTTAAVTTAQKPAVTTAAATAAPVTTAAITIPTVTAAEAVTTAAAPVISAPNTNNPSYLWDYSQKWCYSQLNDNFKTAYKRLFEAVQSGSGKCNVEDLNLTQSDMERICFAFDCDNGQFLSISGEYGCETYSDSGNVANLFATTRTNSNESSFKAKADQIIAAAKTKANDYEKLKYIHDTIINNCVYYSNYSSDEKFVFRADGPLVYGKAVCGGYSKAFMYFAQELGIPCVCVMGTAKGEHMWNMVKLGDSWYHIDLTWDDPIASDGSDILRYDYFLISDSEILKNHTKDSRLSYPSAPNNFM